MALTTELPLENRLVHLFQHLGITQAHIAACRAADWYGLATAHPDLVASLTLVCPPPMDPSALHPLASRLLVVTGDQGPAAARVRQRLTPLPGVTMLTLRDTMTLMWSDVIADRTADIGTATPICSVRRRPSRGRRGWGTLSRSKKATRKRYPSRSRVST